MSITDDAFDQALGGKLRSLDAAPAADGWQRVAAQLPAPARRRGVLGYWLAALGLIAIACAAVFALRASTGVLPTGTLDALPLELRAAAPGKAVAQALPDARATDLSSSTNSARMQVEVAPRASRMASTQNLADVKLATTSRSGNGSSSSSSTNGAIPAASDVALRASPSVLSTPTPQSMSTPTSVKNTEGQALDSLAFLSIAALDMGNPITPQLPVLTSTSDLRGWQLSTRLSTLVGIIGGRQGSYESSYAVESFDSNSFTSVTTSYREVAQTKVPIQYALELEAQSRRGWLAYLRMQYVRQSTAIVLDVASPTSSFSAQTKSSQVLEQLGMSAGFGYRCRLGSNWRPYATAGVGTRWGTSVSNKFKGANDADFLQGVPSISRENDPAAVADERYTRFYFAGLVGLDYQLAQQLSVGVQAQALGQQIYAGAAVRYTFGKPL